MSVLPQRVFVTGTDTDVGKTVISAILTVGMQAKYWKPVQSGNTPHTDTGWIKSACELSADGVFTESYSLRQPLSPHLSARLDGVEIKIDKFVLPSVTQAPRLIVEGAGGLLVPLNSTMLMIDLASFFALPVLLVARSGLGTINHTLLSVAAIRQAGLELAGVVMNGPANIENRKAIETYGQVSVLAEVPHLELLSGGNRELLEQAYEKYFVRQTREEAGDDWQDVATQRHLASV